jgi:hypothetical protein
MMEDLMEDRCLMECGMEDVEELDRRDRRWGVEEGRKKWREKWRRRAYIG